MSPGELAMQLQRRRCQKQYQWCMSKKPAKPSDRDQVIRSEHHHIFIEDILSLMILAVPLTEKADAESLRGQTHSLPPTVALSNPGFGGDVRRRCLRWL